MTRPKWEPPDIQSFDPKSLNYMLGAIATEMKGMRDDLDDYAAELAAQAKQIEVSAKRLENLKTRWVMISAGAILIWGAVVAWVAAWIGTIHH